MQFDLKTKYAVRFEKKKGNRNPHGDGISYHPVNGAQFKKLKSMGIPCEIVCEFDQLGKTLPRNEASKPKEEKKSIKEEAKEEGPYNGKTTPELRQMAKDLKIEIPSSVRGRGSQQKLIKLIEANKPSE